MKSVVRPVVVGFLLGLATFVAHAADRRSGAAGSPGVTFTKDVAPILYNSCIGCHRAGEVAPMSLHVVRGRAAVGEVDSRKVASREMPPWGADPRYGKFKDDRSLSDAANRHDREVGRRGRTERDASRPADAPRSSRPAGRTASPTW